MKKSFLVRSKHDNWTLLRESKEYIFTNCFDDVMKKYIYFSNDKNLLLNSMNYDFLTKIILSNKPDKNFHIELKLEIINDKYKIYYFKDFHTHGGLHLPVNIKKFKRLPDHLFMTAKFFPTEEILEVEREINYKNYRSLLKLK